MGEVLNGTQRFLHENAWSSSAESSFRKYLELHSRTDKIDADSLIYLKRFLHEGTNVCEGIIRKYKNCSLSLVPWGKEYMHLLSYISAFYLDSGEFEAGMIWAKKSIDMIPVFTPGQSPEMMRKIIRDLPATTFFCEHSQHFNQSLYDRFYLDWEVKYFIQYDNKYYCNDN